MMRVQPSKRAQGARGSVIREILRLTEDGSVLSLAGGVPAAEAIPLDDLRRAATGLGREAFQYAPTEGYAPLRAVLARQLATALARPVTEAEIAVTSGSQQALDLLGRALLDPGDLVAVEHPGYLGAVQALETYQPVFLPVRVDADGLDVAELAGALAGGARPKLVYTVPNFSNPSGATLTAERRLALAALAERYGFLIIEDDPYGHLRFRGTPLPPVATHSDHVALLGTVSKSLAPGLRVGWVSGPAELVALVVRAKQAADLQASTLGQALAAELLGRQGWMAAQTARIVPGYARRQAALVAALAAHVGDRIELGRCDGGMFLWGRLTAAGADSDRLLTTALDAGVAFVPGSAFGVPGAPPLRDGLRLSFASLEPDRLEEAARRLAGVL